MSTELVSQRRAWRSRVPEDHRSSIDTRLRWLWNQRFGTLQAVWRDSPDPLDRMASTMLVQAIVRRDLDSISLIFQRLEGSPLDDGTILEQKTIRV